MEGSTSSLRRKTSNAIIVASRYAIPSLDQYGSGFRYTQLGAPKNTPAEIIDKLNSETSAGLADPTMKTLLTDLGGAPTPMPPAEFRKLIANETEKWGKVIRAGNIKAE